MECSAVPCWLAAPTNEASAPVHVAVSAGMGFLIDLRSIGHLITSNTLIAGACQSTKWHLIVARFADLFYYVVPTFRISPGDGLPLPGSAYPFAFLADIGLPILMGGLWVWVWAGQMKQTNAPLVPIYDERIENAWPVEAAQETVSTSSTTTERGLRGATSNG